VFLQRAAQDATGVPSDQEVSALLEFFKVPPREGPLQLQLHRPIPLRQYDPRLTARNPMNELPSEHNMRKQRNKSTKKRQQGVRVTANVVREAQDEREERAAARREKKHNEIISELQQQQHLMKTVDNFKAAAKKKKKR